MEKIISLPATPFSDSRNSTAQVPTVDFSLLTAGTPDQRSKVIQLIGDACREWGFFLVTNHSMPRTLMDEMLNVGKRFFDLTDEERREYAGKQVLDSISYGKRLQREYLKVHAHPHFHAPAKPADLGEITKEYCKIAREVAGELLKGISKSLGLEESYIHEKMDMESGFQLYVVNVYCPRPQPEVVTGIPPHSDYGVLTLLIQNEPGLQILHNGEWVPVNPPPYSFFVNVADQLEILSNGQCKSVIHRAILDDKATRISVVSSHGPPLGTIVMPAPEFVDGGSESPAYREIEYGDYIKLKHSTQLAGKSCLDYIRL